MSLIHLFYFIITSFIFYLVFRFFLSVYDNRNINHICSYDFPIDISFELVEEGIIKRFLSNLIGGRQELEIGKKIFDNKIYISSDIAVIKKVLMNNEIQDIVLKVLDNKYINGIYINKKQIKIITKNLGKTNNIYSSLDKIYSPYILQLKNLLIEECNKIRIDGDDANFTKNMRDKILKLKSFYCSLFITGIIFTIYFCLADKDNYINLEFFNFKQLMCSTLSLFIPIILTTLYITKNSSRRHLLLGNILGLLLPACFISGLFFLYHLNIYLDTSNEVVSVETFDKGVRRVGRGKDFYLYFRTYNNEDLRKYSRIGLTMHKYYNLPSKGEVTIGMKKGYFNNPYISIKNK